jgi:hypothetical protein
MSKITRTEGLVLLILALGTVCLFNCMTTRANGEGPIVISVIINGVDVSRDPHTIVEARLRTSVTVNVTWSMLYTPGIQYGWMQVSLYNNASKIQNSTRFTDRGTKINQIWACSLIPGEWTLVNNKEYGRVEVTLLKFDGIEIFSNTTRYTIKILPEQVNLSLSSYNFKNDSNGRMKHLNASYYVTSKQDPSFHHPNLQFSCTIFDETDTPVQKADIYVNSLGFLNVIIDREYLIFMEEQTMKITNKATTLIEPISIETNMGSIVNRTDFLLYYRNLTEIHDDEDVSVVLNLEAATSTNRTGGITYPLYYEWTASNGTEPPFQNGTSYAYLGVIMSINLDPSLTPIIEQLSVDIWFEGNFILKSKQISLRLRDQVFREEIDINLMNQATLKTDGIGDLCFQLKGKQTAIPVSSHPVSIDIVNETAGEPLSSLMFQTNVNGCTTISLSEIEIQDLEHIKIQVHAFSNLTFKESIRTFHMGEIFIRVPPILRLNNKSMSFTLCSNCKNIISMSVLADRNDSYFSGRLTKLVFFDEVRVVILECSALVGHNGAIECALPVQVLRAGQTVFVSVMLKATLTSQELSSIVQFQVVAIIDSGNTATTIAVASAVFLLAAVIGVMITIRCVKTARHNFLSKDQFTIIVA